MAYDKPVAIESVAFEEESLASGRKLLHFIFKQKFGNYHYKWTPPWKGDFGIERLFFKALETEEWNDYDGVWSKEFKQASKEIPSLDKVRLPVRITLSEVLGPIKSKFTGEETYRATIEILSDEATVWQEEKAKEYYICIDQVKMPFSYISDFLAESPIIKGVGESENVRGDEWPYEEILGVRFYVWIEAGEEKAEYQVIGKELAANIRSFIRKRLSDYRALNKGFEEP